MRYLTRGSHRNCGYVATLVVVFHFSRTVGLVIYERRPMSAFWVATAVSKLTILFQVAAPPKVMAPMPFVLEASRSVI